MRKKQAGGGRYVVMTSPICQLQDGCAVVLVAAQPDPRQPSTYLLDATVVAERPLRQPLRLVARWQGGERTAAVDPGAGARLRGIPATALQALPGQALSGQGLRLALEPVARGGHALG